MRGAVARIGLLAWGVVCAACATHAALRPASLEGEPGCMPAAPPASLWAMPLAAPVSGTVRFVPGGSPAARYNDAPSPVPHTALGDAVMAAARDEAARGGLPEPEPDARLFATCADLAEVAPEDRSAAIPFDDSVVAFALQRNGIIEPAVRLLYGWGDAAAPEQFVRELRPKLAEALRAAGAVRLGVGLARRDADGTAAIVLALQRSAVSTLPIPRGVASQGEVVIDAVLDPRFHDPEVFVTTPSGDTRQVDVRSGRPGGFVAQVACHAHDGRQQIEITASGASGATVLANFPVWCAAEPPRALPVRRASHEAIETPQRAEQALLAAIDRDRAAAGLPALRRDGEVAAVARGHADEMRRLRAVAHVSAATGSAADRVAAAGIATRLVLENVAHAYSVEQAHRALMDSPGHRANILSVAATDVGIGVAFGEDAAGRRELFIAQLFTRAPGPGESSQCDRAAQPITLKLRMP
jgi:uncharacterized protein YkwD